MRLEFYLNFQYFSNIFCTRLSGKCSSWKFGSLSSKHGTNNHFAMVEDSILWSFGPCYCLNQVKSVLSAYLKSFKTLLQINAALKKCQTNVNLAWKTPSKLFRRLGMVKNKLTTFTDCLKNFRLEILSFLSRQLGTNNCFPMAEGSLCLYFGPDFCLNQVKSPFSD